MGMQYPLHSLLFYLFLRCCSSGMVLRDMLSDSQVILPELTDRANRELNALRRFWSRRLEENSNPPIGNGTNTTEIKLYMDMSKDPCGNFNDYACGGYRDLRRSELATSQVGRLSPFDTLTRDTLRKTKIILVQATCSHPTHGKSWVENVLPLSVSTGEYNLLYQGACNSVLPASTPVPRLLASIGSMYAKCLDNAHLETESIPAVTALIDSIMPGCQLARATDQNCIFTKRNLSVALATVARRVDANDVFFGMQVVWDSRDTSKRIFQINGHGSIGSVTLNSGRRDALEAALQPYFDDAVSKGFPRRLNATKMLDFYTTLGSVYYTSTLDIPEGDMKYRSIQELDAAFPSIDWQAMFSTFYPGVDAASIGEIESRFEAPFFHMDNLLRNTSQSELADIVAGEVLMAEALSMPASMRAHLNTYQETYSYALNHEQMCYNRVAEFGKWALSKPYVEKYFAPRNKRLVEQIADDIGKAFKASLPDLEWMDSYTMQKAIDKADAMVTSIGYPEWLMSNADKLLEKYRTSDGVDFADLNASTFLDANAYANQISFDHELSLLFRPVDRTDWYHTPIDISPYYNTLLNKVVFPAAFLQPPFFNFDFPPAYLYGSVGFVMGHELTHGFDWEGSTRDAYGTEVGRWFSAEARAAFTSGSNCFLEQYGAATAYPTDDANSAGFEINAERTLSENIADAGGVALAYAAYRARYASIRNNVSPLQGLTNAQLMLVGAGQTVLNCALVTTKFLNHQLSTDAHAPGSVRGYLPFLNFKEFASEFSCPLGSMMRPAKTCSIWTVNYKNSEPESETSVAHHILLPLSIFSLIFIV